MGNAISRPKATLGKLWNGITGADSDEGRVEIGKTLDQAKLEAQHYISQQQNNIAQSNASLTMVNQQQQNLQQQVTQSQKELEASKSQVSSLESQLSSLKSSVSWEANKGKELQAKLSIATDEAIRQQAILNATLLKQAEDERALAKIIEDINSDKNQLEYLNQELEKAKIDQQRITDSERLLQTTKDLIEQLPAVDINYRQAMASHLVEEESEILGSILANLEHQ